MNYQEYVTIRGILSTSVSAIPKNSDYQDLAIVNRGPGEQLSVARPPGRVIGAPQTLQK
jgi:hypothetical protein